MAVFIHPHSELYLSLYLAQQWTGLSCIGVLVGCDLDAGDIVICIRNCMISAVRHACRCQARHPCGRTGLKAHAVAGLHFMLKHSTCRIMSQEQYSML